MLGSMWRLAHELEQVRGGHHHRGSSFERAPHDGGYAAADAQVRSVGVNDQRHSRGGEERGVDRPVEVHDVGPQLGDRSSDSRPVPTARNGRSMTRATLEERRCGTTTMQGSTSSTSD